MALPDRSIYTRRLIVGGMCLAVAAGATAVASATAATGATAASSASPDCRPGLIQVKLVTPVASDGEARARISGLARAAGPVIDAHMTFPTAAPGFANHARKAELGLDRWVRVTLPPGADVAAEVARWAGHPGVETEECEPVVLPAAVPTDPLYPQQWQHANTGVNPTVPAGTPDADMDTQEAWDTQAGSVRVATLESTDWYHPDLVNTVWQNLGEDLDGDGGTIEWDSTLARWVLDPGDANLFDDDGNGFIDDLIGFNFDDGGNEPDLGPSGHGTGTAGLFLAEPNNGTAIAGTCLDCTLIAIKASQNLPAGLVYAADLGAAVINLSLWGNSYPQVFEDALEYVHGLGTVVVVAAGNGDASTANELCRNQKALCAGASDNRDRIVTSTTTGGAWGSNWGPALDVSAPGIHLTYLLEGTGSASGGSGTSFSTPLVSGVAALVKSENPALSADEVISIMQSTTDPFVSATRFAGLGRVNAKSAVDAAAAAATFGSFPVGVIQHLDTGFTPQWDLEIYGTADSPDFSSYRIRVGEGLQPATWLADEQFFSPVQDGQLYSINLAAFPGSTGFRIELEVHDTNGQVAVDAQYPMEKSPSAVDLPGWPLFVPNLFASPAMGELDGTPGLEIVVARQDTLYAYDADGSALPGWPLPGFTNVDQASPPALADFDGDGRDEIVVAWWANGGPYWLGVLEDDGTFAPGWPQAVSDRARFYPLVGDVDGDGAPEIVLPIGLVPFTWEIAAYETDGAVVPGWPVTMPNGFSAWTLPCLGDVDGDGDLEIGINVGSTYHVFDGDGSILPGWPLVESSVGDQVVADLDGDGKDEILRAHDTDLFVHEEDGSVAPGWPVTLANNLSQLLVADADRDGEPEIYAKTTSREIYAVSADGAVRPGWPLIATAASVLFVVTEADGDPELEVLYGDANQIWAVDPDGTVGTSWPLAADPGVVSGLVFGDAGGDGILEMLLTVDRAAPDTGMAVMHVLDRGGPITSGDWARKHADARNTRRWVSSVAVGVSPPVGGPTRFLFEPPRPNPSGGPVAFSWTLPAASRTRLRLYDVTGRLVATLVDGPLPAGRHSAVWSGHARGGRTAAAGVYFARLEAPPFVAVRKIVGGRR